MKQSNWLPIIMASILIGVVYLLAYCLGTNAHAAITKPYFGQTEEPRRCSGVFKKDATSPSIFLPSKPPLVRNVVMRWTQLILNQMDEAAFFENRWIKNDGYDPIVKRAGYRAAYFTAYESSPREVLFLIVPFNSSRTKVQVSIRRVPNGIILDTDGVDLSTEKELLAIVQGEK